MMSVLATFRLKPSLGGLLLPLTRLIPDALQLPGPSEENNAVSELLF